MAVDCIITMVLPYHHPNYLLLVTKVSSMTWYGAIILVEPGLSFLRLESRFSIGTMLHYYLYALLACTPALHLIPVLIPLHLEI